MTEHIRRPEELQSRELVSKPHYAEQIKLLIDMYNSDELPNVSSVLVEPRYGYLATISYHEGDNRIVYSNNPGANIGSAESLAKDKGYTKFVLRELGINCPDGEEFLLPWWATMLRESVKHGSAEHIQDTSSATDYIEQSQEYPVFVKPANGSQGNGVHKVYDPIELQAVFDEFESEQIKVAMVERAIDMPDYRLLVHNGELVTAYERQHLSVTGDGQQTIAELLQAVDTHFKSLNREIFLERQIPHIERHIGRTGLVLGDILDPDQTVKVLAVSNLSAGGTPRGVSETIHPHWIELATTIASKFGLKVCGIDLACEDITSADSDYSIIEVNGSPGVKHFVASSPDDLKRIHEMYRSIFNTPL